MIDSLGQTGKDSYKKVFPEIEGYNHISKSVQKAKYMMQQVREGKIKPLFTSSKKETEKIGGYYPSDQIVIAGRSGTGKTAKALHDIADFCDNQINPYYNGKIIILYDSYEMVDWRGVLRLVSRKGEVEAKALLDHYQRLSQERYEALLKIADTFSHLPIYITNRPKTASQWEESKKQIQGKYPQHYIINLFDHTRLGLKENEGKEEELITNFMVRGVYLKNNFSMWNIFLSQMNRNIETAISRDKLGTHLPVASDIFGSDAVMQCADVVLALHRPGLYGIEYFEDIPTGYRKSDPNTEDNLLVECVLKQREGWVGNILMKHCLKYNHVEDYILPTSTTYPQLNTDFQ